MAGSRRYLPILLLVVFVCLCCEPFARAQPACKTGRFAPSWTKEAPFSRLAEVETKMKTLMLRGTTCAARLKDDPRGPDASGEWNWHGENWEESQFLLRCLWLDVFRRAKPASHDCLGDFRLGPAIADQLPSTMALVASSPEQRGMTEQQSLRAYLPKMTFSQVSETELSGKLDQGDEYEDDLFILLGSGDFDGDGYRDVVIASRNTSKGSYGELGISVLSRTTPTGVFSHRFRER
jgi:hypothetical protein